MVKFCGKCGSKLDEQTGLCPVCNETEKTSTPIKHPETVESKMSDKQLNAKPVTDATRKQKRNQRKDERKAKKAQVKASRTFGQKVKRFFLCLLIWILILSVISVAFVGVLSYFQILKIPFFDSVFSLVGINSSKDRTYYDYFEGPYSDVTVIDSETAKQSLQDASNKLGYENAFDDLTELSVDEFEETTYYRFQQCFEGVPIWGRTIVVLADSDGNTMGLSGNVFDVPSNTNTHPQISQEEAFNSIKRYFNDNIAGTSEYLSIQNLDEADLYLYNLDNKNNYQLIYQIIVATEYGPYVALINAVNSNIVSFESATKDVQTEVTLDGQNTKQQLFVEKNDSDYQMKFKSGNTNYSTFVPRDGHMYDYYLNQDNAILVTWNDNRNPDKSAVDAMANAEKVYNYYKKQLNRDSLDGNGSSLNIYVQTAGYKKQEKDEDNYNNAFYWGKHDNGTGQVDIISFPKCFSDYDPNKEVNSYSCDLEVVGHEMTHGVVDYTCNLTSTDENDMPSAINEAVSDIFGFFVEARNKNEEPDWTNSVRTAIKEQNTSNKQLYHYRDYKKETDGHYGATIITYAAYLMFNGVNGDYHAISVDNLERLWYRALLTMPSDCTFQVLRYNIEMAAENMAFSESQRECISAAFDEVGIDSWANSKSDEYNTEFDLSVLSEDGKPYDNYSVEVTGQRYTGWFGWGWFREDYHQKSSYYTDDIQKYHLDVGEYTVVVSDIANEDNKQEKFIKVKNNGRLTELKFTTSFKMSGANNKTSHTSEVASTERNIVLVLDRSGSMSGTPLNETKKAATKFVNTVLDQDASIGIVTYDDVADMVSPFTTNKTELISDIDDIDSGGSTNIEDGLKTADNMLTKNDSNKKIIVLMSDGEPNEGRGGKDLIAYANELKEKGIYIYTLGFFESLSGKSSAQYLMEKIASEGCHYEVSDADSLVYFFGDIADQISGQKYIYVRIACPVDVSVSYEGETLDSSDRSLNTRTSFGTLTFEEAGDYYSYDGYDSSQNSNDTVKTLRLKEGVDYDISIVGTGTGRMNYSIGFMDDDGEYTDFRRFNNIRINRRTKIDTVAEVADNTVLNVDEDGDGKYDIKYRAEANGYGKEVDYSFVIYTILSLVGVLVLLIIVLVIHKKIKKRKVR